MELTIELPESVIREAVEGIPPDFYYRTDGSPTVQIALALKKAYDRARLGEKNAGH